MTDPRLPRQLLGYRLAHRRRPDTPAAARPTGTADPLGWCVIATTALLTWLIGPVVLAVLATIGFAKYWRAWRSGRTDSSCVLGDVRLVLIYLAVLGLIGATATVLTR